jgi:hypothetical protein
MNVKKSNMFSSAKKRQMKDQKRKNQIENLEIEFSKLRPERGGALLSKINGVSFFSEESKDTKTGVKDLLRTAKLTCLISGFVSWVVLTLLNENSQHFFLKPQSAFFFGQQLLKLSKETYTLLLLLQAIRKTVMPVADSNTAKARKKAKDLSTMFFIT